MDRRYFPGLNALRTFAAISVIIAHVTTTPFDLLGVPKVDTVFDLLGLSGWDAVTFFFVLSGFLITYMLLEERTKTGAIDVRRFYQRRSQRILPLYYLNVLVGFGVLPLLFGGPLAHVAPSIVIGVLALVPQLPFVFVIGSLSYMGHLWSIGIEEVFYFSWAALLSRIRKPMRLIACVIAVDFVLQLLLNVAEISFHTPTLFALDLLIRYARFEAMAIGATAAYLLIRHAPVLRIVYHPLVARMAATILIVCVVVPSPNFWLTDYALAVVFAIVILNVSTNPRKARPERRISFVLGQLSYGLYMWHMPVLFVLVYGGVTGWTLYPLTMVLTLLVAWVSYHAWERRFLHPHRPVPVPVAS